MHINNKNKYVLIFSGGPTQGLHDADLTAEAKYPNNFTLPSKIFILRLHYNGSNCFFFVNATKTSQFKQKIQK